MDVLAHYPERIRIDRTTDTGRFLGPFDADRTNGRSDMDSCIYVRADIHAGAVEACEAAREFAGNFIRYVDDDEHLLAEQAWDVVRKVNAAVGGQ